MLIDEQLNEAGNLLLDNDEEVIIEEDKLEVKLARLVMRQVPDTTIRQIYGLSKSDFEKIKQSSDFIKAAQQAGEELHVVPVEIDTTWDDIERKSLKRLQTSLKTGYMTPDELLRTASAANRASRKGNEKDATGNKDAGTNRITLEFSANFLSIANNQTNFLERNAELKEISSDAKMVDFMKPTDFEKFIDEKVKPETDFFEKLAQMSIGSEVTLDQ